MTTIVVSGSTTSTVSTHIPSGTSYVVLAGGTLDVVSGGIVSGLVTISLGGTEHISSGGLVLNTSIGGGSAFGAGLQFIISGGTPAIQLFFRTVLTTRVSSSSLLAASRLTRSFPPAMS